MLTPPPYVQEIHKQLIEVFKLQEHPERSGQPKSIPDGVYPMTIEGKRDHVRVEEGNIHYYNF